MSEASASDLIVRPLDASHDRRGFSCGVEALDAYFRTQAGQDARRRASGVFVLAAPARPAEVLGYYTLSALSVAPGEVPEGARAHLPRYPQVSATLIGRLAVATSRQGEGLGGVLLLDALRRAYASAATVGASMIVVDDALSEAAARFYEAFGFVRFPESPRLMFPLRRVAELLSAPS